MQKSVTDRLNEFNVASLYEAFVQVQKYVTQKTLLRRRRRGKIRKFILLHDGGEAAELAARTLTLAQAANDIDSVDIIRIAADTPPPASPFRNSAILLFADTNSASRACRWLECAEAIMKRAASGKGNTCLCVIQTPGMTDIPDGIKGLAEREYDYFLQNYADIPEDRRNFYFSIRNLCRKYLIRENLSVSILQSFNTFGVTCDEIGGFSFGDCAKELSGTRTMVIAGSDFSAHRSCAYCRDVSAVAFWAIYNFTDGNIYNYAPLNCTLAELKYEVYLRFQDKVSLRAETPPISGRHYQGVCQLKCQDVLNLLPEDAASAFVTPLRDAVTLSVASRCGELPELEQNISIYTGRLMRIQHLELEILKEIDRLCEKHSIDYFLAGGSLLGAIRYGHSIPWDDDLDIGFSRENFEKFRIVCEKDLDRTRFVHSCYYNETQSHYPVDKIRLKDTCFSTDYSIINQSPDGIFVDCLVYDATSSNPHLAKIHGAIANILSKAIAALWIKKRPKNILYLLFYEICNIFPLSFIQRLLETVLKWYSKEKRPRFVIDSTGKLIGKGVLDAENLFEYRKVPFDEGFSAPVPRQVEKYLTFAYGPDYIEEPPLNKRIAPHDFCRIDLGKYVFSTLPIRDFREEDPRGELYEADAKCDD